MKELRNGIKIIGIDHGYGNIKTAGTVTPTGITASSTEPVFAGNILHYDGMYYRMGEGHKEFIPDKAQDNDFYLFTLMAIARELSQFGICEANVHIAAGLPLTWVKTQRESFRNYLTRNPEVRFKFRDKEYQIRIVGCSVFPQGYTAVIDRLFEMTGVNMLADIGSGDIGYIDEDGFVFIKDRIKRIIIRHDGFKVFPSLIEKTVSTNKNVISNCAVGIADNSHRQGKLPIVFAVLDDNTNKGRTKAELFELCKKELPEYVQPIDFVFIDNMPLTSVGKIDYRALEQQSANQNKE